MKILEFPNYRQTYNYDCGAKAVQAVLAYYGMDVREDKIIKLARTRKGFGTSINGIVKTIKSYGLKCKIKQLTIDEIKNSINKKQPVILSLQAWADKLNVDWKTDWKDGHYVVVIGYDKHKLYFEDPSSILRTYLTYKELMKRWHDVDIRGKKYIDYGIIVYGKKNVYSSSKSIHMN